LGTVVACLRRGLESENQVIKDELPRRDFLELLVVLFGSGLVSSCSSPFPGVASPTASPTKPSVVIVDLDNIPGGYGSKVGQDRSLLLVSMQGILNRKKPTLWLKSNPGQSAGMDLWENKLEELDGAKRLTYQECIDRFAGNGLFQGLVVADSAMASTYDLATTLAGLYDLMIATDRTLSDLSNTGVPIKFDLRGAFQHDMDVIGRIRDLASKANLEMMMRQIPWDSAAHFNAPERARDFAIRNRHLVAPIAHDYTLTQFYGDNWPSPILYGMVTNELEEVTQAGVHGKLWLGVDTNTYNLSFLSALSTSSSFPVAHKSPSASAPEKKIYLCFIFSDGDNPKIDVETMARNWQDPARGAIPLGWSIAPLMAKVAPRVLEHFYSTQTDNDCFLAGESGIAYYYANVMNVGAFPGFWDLTRQYLRLLNISTVWTVGHLGIERTDNGFLEQFAINYSEVIGWYDGYGDPSGRHGLQRYEDSATLFVASRPSVPFRAWLPDSSMSTPETALSVAKQDLEYYVSNHPTRPLFVPVGVPIYPPHNWSPSKIRQVLDSLNIGEYEVVRPDDMLAMIKLANG